MTTLHHQDLLDDYGQGTIWSLTSNNEICTSLSESSEPIGDLCMSRVRRLLLAPLCWMQSWQWQEAFGVRDWMGKYSEELL